MIKVICPICERTMAGASSVEWPQFPFCSERCRLIDLGRWLGAAYAFPAGAEDDENSAVTENQDPS